MPALNWYLTATTSAGGNRTVDEATQGAASSADGWTVSTTGDSNTSAYAIGVKRAATTFTSTTQPDGSIDTSLDDALRTTNTYSGSFAAANWTLTFVVRAPTTATTHTGAMVVRLLRGTAADGSNATEINAGQKTGTTTATMTSTTTDYTSTVTFNPGAFSVSGEYLFFQIAWKRIAAGGMTTADVVFRTGSSASAGTRFVSSTFTVNHTTTGAVVGTNGAVAGAAARSTPTVTHTTSGAITGTNGAIAGSAARATGTAGLPVTSGLTVWLDATKLALADNAALSSWPDQSGGAHHGSITGTPAPVMKTNVLNGKPVVRFSAGQSSISGTGVIATTGTADLTIIYVGRMWGATAGRIFSGSSGNNFLVGTHSTGIDTCYDEGWVSTGTAWPAPPSPWRLWGYRFASLVGSFFSNGVAAGTGTANTTLGHGSGWLLNGYAAAGAETCDCEVAEFLAYDRALSTTERTQVESYLNVKWGLGLTLPVTHDTSGAITATRGPIAGSAARSAGVVTHATTGAITGAGRVVAGTAKRFRAHATTGVITGAGRVVVGVSKRFRTRTTTGAIVGSGRVISGVARRFRTHATTGVVAGTGRVVVGTAARIGGPTPHPTTGAIVATRGPISGVAKRFRTHTTTGVVTATRGPIAGTARHNIKHPTTGAITGTGRVISGAAKRFRTHATTGTPVGSGRVIAGVARNFTVHTTTGAVVGTGRVVAGTALHRIKHVTTGAIAATRGPVSGVAVHAGVGRSASGALRGAAALLAGAAWRGRATPSSLLRQLTIGPEDRFLVIAPEDHTLVVGVEGSAGLVVGVEDRALIIGVDERVLIVGVEDRNLSIGDESRVLITQPG